MIVGETAGASGPKTATVGEAWRAYLGRESARGRLDRYLVGIAVGHTNQKTDAITDGVRVRIQANPTPTQDAQNAARVMENDRVWTTVRAGAGTATSTAYSKNK
eukprot:gene19990-biopygen10084